MARRMLREMHSTMARLMGAPDELRAYADRLAAQLPQLTAAATGGALALLALPRGAAVRGCAMWQLAHAATVTGDVLQCGAWQQAPAHGHRTRRCVSRARACSAVSESGRVDCPDDGSTPPVVRESVCAAHTSFGTCLDAFVLCVQERMSRRRARTTGSAPSTRLRLRGRAMAAACGATSGSATPAATCSACAPLLLRGHAPHASGLRAQARPAIAACAHTSAQGWARSDLNATAFA